MRCALILKGFTTITGDSSLHNPVKLNQLYSESYILKNVAFYTGTQFCTGTGIQMLSGRDTSYEAGHHWHAEESRRLQYPCLYLGSQFKNHGMLHSLLAEGRGSSLLHKALRPGLQDIRYLPSPITSALLYTLGSVGYTRLVVRERLLSLSPDKSGHVLLPIPTPSVIPCGGVQTLASLVKNSSQTRTTRSEGFLPVHKISAVPSWEENQSQHFSSDCFLGLSGSLCQGKSCWSTNSQSTPGRKRKNIESSSPKEKTKVGTVQSRHAALRTEH